MSTELTLTNAVNACLAYSFACANDHINNAMNHKRSGYSIFRSEQHRELTESIPDMSERSRKIAELWKDETVRKKYNDLANE